MVNRLSVFSSHVCHFCTQYVKKALGTNMAQWMKGAYVSILPVWTLHIFCDTLFESIRNNPSFIDEGKDTIRGEWGLSVKWTGWAVLSHKCERGLCFMPGWLLLRYEHFKSQTISIGRFKHIPSSFTAWSFSYPDEIFRWDRQIPVKKIMCVFSVVIRHLGYVWARLNVDL